MGFGHRVYKAGGVRAGILKPFAEGVGGGQCAVLRGNRRNDQRILAAEKNLYPNLDWPSARMYHARRAGGSAVHTHFRHGAGDGLVGAFHRTAREQPAHPPAFALCRVWRLAQGAAVGPAGVATGRAGSRRRPEIIGAAPCSTTLRSISFSISLGLGCARLHGWKAQIDHQPAPALKWEKPCSTVSEAGDGGVNVACSLDARVYRLPKHLVREEGVVTATRVLPAR